MSKTLKIDSVSAELFKQLSKGSHDVAFEDVVNGYWYLYTVDTGEISPHAFGDIALNFINIGVTLQPENVNYQANYDNYTNNGIAPDFVQSVQDNAVKCCQGFGDLKKRLLMMPKKRKTASAYTFAGYADNTLYAYTPLYDFDYWASHCSDINPNDYDGFPMTSAYHACEKFSLFTAFRCKELVPVTITIDGVPVSGRVFRLDKDFGAGCLFPVDLRYLIQNTAVHECVRCGQLYRTNNSSARYCHDCKQIVGKQGIANERRRANRARYLHKRILDKLNSKANTSGVNPENFRNESNYYWDRILGKKPAAEACYDVNGIDTEERYTAWLESFVDNPYVYLKHRYDATLDTPKQP